MTPSNALTPQVMLATSVHAQPGVYAALLGSGASTAAGIPTGWGVVTNLVGRVAAAAFPQDEAAQAEATSDPAAWWALHGSGDLGYSSLLAALAPTAGARQALLASFFEATDDERDEGLKAPTAGHLALARLVKRGSIKVILTTNFDRLIERALDAEGVSAQVVARPDALVGMTPLAHASATVIKLHGDYADLGIRNTVDELSTYPAEWQALLDQVLSEYGLIIAGWSAEWDPALTASLERVASRRYPTFWDSRSSRREHAQRLVALRGIEVLQADSADELFTSLESSVGALDRLSQPPLTTAMAVARLKRWLPDPIHRIDLYDLVMGEVDDVLDKVQQLPTAGKVTTGALNDAFVHHLRATQPLLALLVEGVRHDDDLAHESLWCDVLERLIGLRYLPGSQQQVLVETAHYPALLAFQAMAVVSVRRGQDRLLLRLAEGEWWTDPYNRRAPMPTAQALHIQRVLQYAGRLPRWGDTRYYYPESEMLRRDLRESLRSMIPNDDDYRLAFSDAEYRIGLIQETQQDSPAAYRAATGLFLGEQEWMTEDGPRAETAFRRVAQAAGSRWPWWRLMGGSDNLDARLLDYREVLGRIRRFN